LPPNSRILDDVLHDQVAEAQSLAQLAREDELAIRGNPRALEFDLYCGCGFRRMPTTRFVSSRPRISVHGDHPFRRMPTTDELTPNGR
jgi:hypothetical protein